MKKFLVLALLVLVGCEVMYMPRPGLHTRESALKTARFLLKDNSFQNPYQRKASINHAGISCPEWWSDRAIGPLKFTPFREIKEIVVIKSGLIAGKSGRLFGKAVKITAKDYSITFYFKTLEQARDFADALGTLRQ